ncbi:hypothetical protein ZWY2020_027613 [Hordeum vulgare]|nr:hypothetical protein ZWY2020_027613 [Hordeum vulgare]
MFRAGCYRSVVPGGQRGQAPAVDAQLWLACAGSMCAVPPVGAGVYYFSQGHAEQATAAVDLSVARVPALLPYRVSAVRFMADEEVFAKIRLIPISHGDPAVDVGAAAAEGRAEDDRPKPASFAKTSIRYNSSDYSCAQFDRSVTTCSTQENKSGETMELNPELKPC